MRILTIDRGDESDKLIKCLNCHKRKLPYWTMAKPSVPTKFCSAYCKMMYNSKGKYGRQREKERAVWQTKRKSQ